MTPASEVWSFGVTLFVLATGQYPFASPEQIYKANLVWPRATPVSHEFMAMIAVMLQKDQKLRPPLDEMLRNPWLCSSQEEQLSTAASSS